jgi:triosephosphate isomerase
MYLEEIKHFVRVKFTSINSHIMHVVICTGNVHCAAFYSVGCGEKILKAKNTSFSQP